MISINSNHLREEIYSIYVRIVNSEGTEYFELQGAKTLSLIRGG